MNMEQTLASCPNCNEVFNFAGLVPARKSKLKLKGPPEGVTVIEKSQQAIVQFPTTYVAWPIFRPLAIVFYVIFIIFQLVFMSPEYAWRIWTLVAILGATVVIAAYLENTQLVMSPTVLIRQYTPIPWMADRIAMAQILDVQVAFQTTWARVTVGIVTLILDNGKKKRVFAGSAEGAEYVAQEIRRSLAERESMGPASNA